MIGLSSSYYGLQKKKVYESAKSVFDLGFKTVELGAAHDPEKNIWDTVKKIKHDFPDKNYTVHGLFPPPEQRMWFNASLGLTKQNNAAVEASHAGELGKGFSVISKEVKDLAEKSKTSAHQVKELSNSGFKIAEEARQKSIKSVEEIDKIQQLIKNISLKSKEQKYDSKNINNAIEQISKIVDRNIKTSNKMKANAKSLHEQSQYLYDTVSHFKT